MTFAGRSVFLRVFGCIRAPALALATVACFGASPPAAAQQQIERLQIVPGPTWSGWEDLQQNTCTQAQQSAGTCFATNSAADCVTTGANRIDCFARVYGGLVARRQWDGQTWQPWRPLLGLSMHYFSNAAPECVAWDQGIDCVARESAVVLPHPSSAPFHFPVSGSATWSALGGVLSSDPECLSPQPGRLDCFGRGTDGALYQNTLQGGAWSGWVGRGDQILELSKPSCVSLSASARIFCVFVTPANQLREFSIFTSGNLPSFRDLTGGNFSVLGNVGPSPKCVVNGDIHCLVPARNGNTAMLAWLSTNGTSNWTLRNAGSTLGGGQALRYDWDCVALQPNRIDCMELVVQGMRRSFGGQRPTGVLLRHGVLTPSSSSGSWGDVALSSAPTSFPSFLDCVSWGADRIDCFASGSPLDATALWHAWFAAPPPPIEFRPNRPLPPIARPPSN